MEVSGGTDKSTTSEERTYLSSLPLSMIYEVVSFYPAALWTCETLSSTLRQRLHKEPGFLHNLLEEVYGNYKTRELTFTDWKQFLKPQFYIVSDKPWEKRMRTMDVRNESCKIHNLNDLPDHLLRSSWVYLSHHSIFLWGGDPWPTMAVDYNIDAGNLSKKQDLQYRHADSALLQVCGTVYIFGGFFFPYEPVDTAEAFSLKTDTWSEVSQLPEVYGATNAIYHNTKIYIVGHLSSKIAEFSPKTNTYRQIPAKLDADKILKTILTNGTDLIIISQSENVCKNIKTGETIETYEYIADMNNSRFGDVVKYDQKLYFHIYFRGVFYWDLERNELDLVKI